MITGIAVMKFPELIWGIGNIVDHKNREKILIEKWELTLNGLYEMKENFYFGFNYAFSDYWNIGKEDTSFLIQQNITGANGGILSGIGPSLIYDSRLNRYNARQGMFFATYFTSFQKFLGSQYIFNSLSMDFRKYFNPWLEHIIAFQVTNTYNYGNVPFFHLSMMGGSDRMRAYYLGEIRDKILIDTQVEYRMPIWKIFGMVGFFGAGRVYPAYSDLTFKDMYFSSGLGLRIMVDSENKANLRLDFAYGENGAKAFIFGFAEAFLELLSEY